jgi:hypothetical protein
MARLQRIIEPVQERQGERILPRSLRLLAQMAIPVRPLPSMYG